MKRKREGESDDSDDDDESVRDNEDEQPTLDNEDEPVLSHAEKRRQKKKERSSKKPKLDKAADAKEPLPKRQNSVWVGNMLFKTTQDDLKGFFKDVGEITRINMPRKPGGKPGKPTENIGFAYVDFATPEAKHAAIALSEHPLAGRKLLIKDGDDFSRAEGAPDPAVAGHKSLTKSGQKILRTQKQPPAPTLFLGNLPFNTTEDSIRQLFESHRDKKSAKSEEPWIKKIRMGTFEDTGACKGFAFVDFSSIEHATSVLVNPKNHHLDGRDLVVEYASPEAVRRGASRPKPSEEKGSSASNVNSPDDAAKAAKERKKAKYNKETRPPKFSKVRREMQQKSQSREKAEEEASPAAPRPSARPSSRPSPRKEGSRPKPGAALAMAKRQSAAILPTSGPSKKITF